jgi:protocatechuate 3,4-dioxygenase, beta subunit
MAHPTLRLARRGLLIGAAALAGLEPRAALAALLATPAQTPGPFYPKKLPLDADNDLVRIAGHTREAAGTITHLFGRVLDTDGRGIASARIEIWQCDSKGHYHHVDDGDARQLDPDFQGYGKTLSAGDGSYRFRTIRPVAYPGRTPHIHFKVATAGSHLTSQFYIAGEAQNERDFVYREAARSAQQRERIEMRLQPASGLEPGALATSMDIVVG